MKEKYLHYLWKYKLLPFHLLKLVNGQAFKVIYQGDYNAYESGPDFLNAKIEIDGIIWSGHVELHVKAMDWYAHKHHEDKAYDSVVLHVVYESNGIVIQNDAVIPALELKNVIQKDHYSKFELLLKNKRTILCGSQIGNVPEIYLTFLQERALSDRLSRKTNNLVELSGSKEPRQVLYFLLARSMGAKINQLPFEELTHRLPLSIVKKAQAKNQSKMVLMASGLVQAQTITELLSQKEMLYHEDQMSRGVVARNSWKFGGTRPGNAPTIRVAQFARIVENFDFEISFVYLSVNDLLTYLMKLMSIFESSSSQIIREKDLTLAFKNQLIINCFVPFIYWYGQQIEDDVLIEKSFEILRLIPAEQNSILNKWNDCGIFPVNAGETQSLLEIFNEFCSKKKCLSCDVGIRILGK